MESRLFRSTGRHSASCTMPPFPGAQYSFETRGDWRNFHASACSRPPLPTRRTFIGGETIRLGVQRKRCQTEANPGSVSLLVILQLDECPALFPRLNIF